MVLQKLKLLKIQLHDRICERLANREGGSDAQRKAVLGKTAATTCEAEREKDENGTGRRKSRGGSRARGRDACSTA